MGINGLLQHLKACCKEKKLHEYRGQRAAVDTYAWYLLSYSGSTKSSKAPVVLPLSKEGRTSSSLSATSWSESINLDAVGSSQSLFLMEDPSPEKEKRNKPGESYFYLYIDAVRKVTLKPKNCWTPEKRKAIKRWLSPLTSVLTWPTTSLSNSKKTISNLLLPLMRLMLN